MWTGQDGSPRASFEVTSQNVRFLSGRDEGGLGGDEGGSAAAPPPDDDIPF